MNDLLAGATAMASAAIGVFFLRYWRKSRDRFFLLFAVAFWIYAANRVGLATVGDEERRLWLYAIRALAFVLILVAIVDKNRAAERRNE